MGIIRVECPAKGEELCFTATFHGTILEPQQGESKPAQHSNNAASSHERMLVTVDDTGNIASSCFAAWRQS